MEEIEYMATIYMGKSMLELSNSELHSFIDICLSATIDTLTLGKEAIWVELRKDHSADEAYKAGLEFPWMFNSQLKLKEVAELLKECKNDTCS